MYLTPCSQKYCLANFYEYYMSQTSVLNNRKENLKKKRVYRKSIESLDSRPIEIHHFLKGFFLIKVHCSVHLWPFYVWLPGTVNVVAN